MRKYLLLALVLGAALSSAAAAPAAATAAPKKRQPPPRKALKTPIKTKQATGGTNTTTCFKPTNNGAPYSMCQPTVCNTANSECLPHWLPGRRPSCPHASRLLWLQPPAQTCHPIKAAPSSHTHMAPGARPARPHARPPLAAPSLLTPPNHPPTQPTNPHTSTPLQTSSPTLSAAAASPTTRRPSRSSAT
jgi:hypothetical protein